MKKILSLVLFSCVFTGVYAQDIDYAREIVVKLSSEEMFGRGYVNQGVNKAADFLSEEMNQIGLKSWEEEYRQQFSFPINTFPSKAICRVNGKELEPVKDFLIQSNAAAINGEYELFWMMDTLASNKKMDKKLRKADLSESFIVTIPVNRELKATGAYGAKGVIFVDDYLAWSVSPGYQAVDYCVLEVHEDLILENTKSIEVDIENKFYPAYETENIIGYVEGSLYPDSFYVFTAHYDHLGSIGQKYYFPGANDNGSGTAMVLDLARYFTENKPEYSVAFMLFTGEEAGLHGSFYYTNNPYFPLSNIKLLINLDMVGSGSKGITLVNSSEVPDVYDKFVKINEENDYLVDVKKRGPSANSDHFPFVDKGVPGIFIYTMGKECPHYHSIFDVVEDGFPFTEYEDLFKLLVKVTE